MTAQRVDYFVRISFTKPTESSDESLEEEAAAVMFDLMKNIMAAAGEAEILRRRIVGVSDRVSPFGDNRLGQVLGRVAQDGARFRSAVRRFMWRWR